MLTTTISDFRKSLKGYVDSVIENNDQVLINRGRQGAVLVSLDEYNALARTASVLTSRVGADVINAAQKQEFIEVDIDSL
ncbi:MAG: type II toxin-antitoxin system Phd/YefM family antitoxin [Bacteroidales bacterium]|nr:type II toxin-antitoxin system Phd/YefM family antitoxin [Bacteroidales bacterium]MBR0297472.1 type II toxin-antitoxin system Phd/YefM family antitoxin [Bacteroidales bacterium]